MNIRLLSYQNWIVGFISGLNYKNQSDKGVNSDNDDIWRAVMSRCQEKPLSSLYEAIQWVYEYELTE